MRDYKIISKKLFVCLFIICSLCAIIRYIVLPKFVFPLKYKEEVLISAQKNGIDPYLVFAIIKAESKFNPNAISRRGAKGLMQIMDTTGEWGAKEIGFKDFTKDQLFKPKVNIEIGSWYIARLLKQYNGDIPTLLAAYNAGTGNVYKWKNNKKYSLDGIIIDYIPFEETRNYIKKVERNFRVYKILYKEF